MFRIWLCRVAVCDGGDGGDAGDIVLNVAAVATSGLVYENPL